MVKEWLKALLGVACIATPIVIAHGKPIAVGSEGGVSVTLFDDPCNLKIQLPAKAVWRENGRDIEGCWGVQGQIVVMYYEADRSIAILPLGAFRPLTSL